MSRDLDANESWRWRLLIFTIFVLSLAATVTNLVPLSLLFVVLVPVIPYLFYRNESLPRSLLSLVLLYVYFFANTMFYYPQSFTEPAFYRRDGNFFVTFLPVLIGGAIAIPVDIERLLMAFLKWATLIDFVFICIYLATGTTVFVREAGVYHFLFEAHNAAGGFLAMVCALALGVYFGGRKTLLLSVVLLVNMAGLLLTVSRGSVLGLVLAVGLVLVLRERFTKTVLTLTAVGMIGLLAFTYPIWSASGKPEGAYYGTQRGLAGQELAVGGDTNTLDRVLFLWPRATDLFLQSPLVGTGFGSYNDLPYHFGGIKHVLSFNSPTHPDFSAAHAHNSYLHVLAETGLIGFGLLLLMLHQMWKDIDAVRPQSVRLALKMAYWVAVFSSLTEHRLVTPSQMLPLTILFGLVLGANRVGVARSGQPRDPGPGHDRIDSPHSGLV